MINTTRRLLSRSLVVRPRRTADEEIGQRSESLDDPLLDVVGQPGSGDGRSEDDGLDEDAGEEELAIGHPRQLDGASKDVGEQQHEHDRLDR